MVKLSSVVQQIIESQRIKFFFLVQLGTDKFFTSLPFDITMDNGITYSSDSGLLGVEPPKASSTVDRAAYSVGFSDVNFLFKNYFEQGATGDNLLVRVGFFNTLGSTTDSTPVGEPFTKIEHTVLSYRGAVDTQKYTVDLSNNEVIATIEGSSPMADLDLVKPYFTSKEGVKSKNSADTSFDQVFDGSGQIKLKWGKV
jgi:hypothetical protein